MKKALSLVLSLVMLASVLGAFPFSALADEIPAPTGLKCTGFSESGSADFEWNEVKFPPLPESVPLTAYDPEAGYTFYWSTDGENWEYEERTNNFIWLDGFTAGNTYYVKVRAWIRTWSRVNTIHASYNYSEYSKTLKFVPKLENTMNAFGKKAFVQRAKLKKKNQTVKRVEAFYIENAQGKLSFKKTKGNKKITVAKNGKITVKKGLKKGTYTIKVTIKAAGNATYKAATQKVTVKIKVM
ncbi:MAG: hypothetical protein K6C14_07220 [Eubacterium sp.]|nr:hypothetical protein [Eubacterium sp.]